LPVNGRQHRGGCIIPHFELIGIINKPLFLHLVGCLHYSKLRIPFIYQCSSQLFFFIPITSECSPQHSFFNPSYSLRMEMTKFRLIKIGQTLNFLQHLLTFKSSQNGR